LCRTYLHAAGNRRARHLTLAETIREQWGAISKFVRSGMARAAGVSQFCATAFAALDEGKARRPGLATACRAAAAASTAR